MQLIDILLDENNKENLTLMSVDSTPIEFEQLAVIPRKEKIYCLLRPVSEDSGLSTEEAIVFALGEDKDSLVAEEDEVIAQDVYSTYLQLLDENDDK